MYKIVAKSEQKSSPKHLECMPILTAIFPISLHRGEKGAFLSSIFKPRPWVWLYVQYARAPSSTSYHLEAATLFRSMDPDLSLHSSTPSCKLFTSAALLWPNILEHISGLGTSCWGNHWMPAVQQPADSFTNSPALCTFHFVFARIAFFFTRRQRNMSVS